MKAFICLLYVAPIAFFIAVAPIAPTLLKQISLAIAVSKGDAWATSQWWDWYGSWIFFGGPIGRWFWGAILGFRILQASPDRHGRYLSGDIIEQPHLRIIAIATPAMVLSLFSLVSCIYLYC